MGCAASSEVIEPQPEVDLISDQAAAAPNPTADDDDDEDLRQPTRSASPQFLAVSSSLMSLEKRLACAKADEEQRSTEQQYVRDELRVLAGQKETAVLRAATPKADQEVPQAVDNAVPLAWPNGAEAQQTRSSSPPAVIYAVTDESAGVTVTLTPIESTPAREIVVLPVDE